MLAFASDAHLAHQPPEILSRGVPVPHVEIARRADELKAAAIAAGCDVQPPTEHGMAPVEAVHDAGYLKFLETAWTRWQALPNPTPYVYPYAQPNRRMSGVPSGIAGEAGYYVATLSAPTAEGTWAAARASADIAVSAAAAVVDGADEAYALCRPPGHHAFSDLAGGFCYLNNVAIAAEYMTRRWPKLAILDVDVHHGNGTQGIFYDRGDVFFASLHGDPSDYFPFFAGYADETGNGDGAGANLNLPLPQGAGDAAFLDALELALAAIESHGAEALLLSLGFDAFENDPIGCLNVTTEGFAEVCRRASSIGLPTVLVQEGGYDCDGLGPNLQAALRGWRKGRTR